MRQAGATSTTDWERQSLPLAVSDAYRAQFQAFSAYFKSEMAAVADDTRSQEVTVLDKLAPWQVPDHDLGQSL